MPLTTAIDDWSRAAGYQYHCFISWPHTNNDDITKCARRLKREIESRLGAYVNPRVFLDESSLTPGDDWPDALKDALCRSLTMVAVCAPIYCNPDHEWCGLEWATMATLSNLRLPGVNYHAIIPVMVRKIEPLPPALVPIQYMDFTGITTLSHYYFLTNEFRTKAEQIVEKIQRVAETIWNNRAESDCGVFAYPTVSAFNGYVPTPTVFPFH